MNQIPGAWPDDNHEFISSLLNSVADRAGTLYAAIISRTREYTRETVEHLAVFAVLYILLCILLYSGVIRWRLFQFRHGVQNAKRVLIVTAHPDDECMFFGPTIVDFVRRDEAVVYIMCLSTGRDNGMGVIRKNELYNACNVLGVKSSNIVVHNHTDLPDQIESKWPTEIVAKLILNHIESYNINTLITFDKHGISNHCNHCSIYYAIAHLSLGQKIPNDCTVYVLETVNILRKYWLFFDIPLSFLLSRTRYLACYSDRFLIHRAMRQHRSQLVWFRRLYMHFSRYMLVNTLQQMDLSDIELDLEIDD